MSCNGDGRPFGEYIFIESSVVPLCAESADFFLALPSSQCVLRGNERISWTASLNCFSQSLLLLSILLLQQTNLKSIIKMMIPAERPFFQSAAPPGSLNADASRSSEKRTHGIENSTIHKGDGGA